MTSYRGLCRDLVETLGRDDALRHAYRVYLWQRAVGLVRHPLSDLGTTANAEFRSEIQASPWSESSSELDAERARRM
jgi:hypothetical protein